MKNKKLNQRFSRFLINKKKAEITTEEVLKIILAVMGLIVLIYLMVSLYGIFGTKTKTQQAKAILEEIENKIKGLSEEHPRDSLLVILPKDWALFYTSNGKYSTIEESYKGIKDSSLADIHKATGGPGPRGYDFKIDSTEICVNNCLCICPYEDTSTGEQGGEPYVHLVSSCDGDGACISPEREVVSYTNYKAPNSPPSPDLIIQSELIEEMKIALVNEKIEFFHRDTSPIVKASDFYDESQKLILKYAKEFVNLKPEETCKKTLNNHKVKVPTYFAPKVNEDIKSILYSLRAIKDISSSTSGWEEGHNFLCNCLEEHNEKLSGEIK